MNKDNIWHVIPVDDDKEHVTESNWKTLQYGRFNNLGLPELHIEQRLICSCECGPTVKEEDNGSLIVVHNSFDGREGLEWINEIFRK